MHNTTSHEIKQIQTNTHILHTQIRNKRIMQQQTLIKQTIFFLDCSRINILLEATFGWIPRVHDLSM